MAQNKYMAALQQQFPSYEELQNPGLHLLSKYSSVLMFFFFVGMAAFQYKRGAVSFSVSQFPS